MIYGKIGGDQVSGYNAFARYYDELTANIDYRKRALYFNEIINRYKTTEGMILLDLACGTGSISEEMARLGYDVIGVDYSDEMLGIAIEKKFDSGLNIQYLCQDMRNIDMFGTIDVTVCALDSINHLQSLDDVRKVFEKVALFAEPQGLFIFDINTVYKHRCVLANNTFTYETDNVYCVWENSLDTSTDSVKMHLEFFERLEMVFTSEAPMISQKLHTVKRTSKLSSTKLEWILSENSATIPSTPPLIILRG